MDLNQVAPLVQKAVKDALAERAYTFGVRSGGRTGITNKIASGTLYDSVLVTVQQNQQGGSLLVDLAAYGQIVNQGRNPGRMPPVEAIKIWLEEKGIGVRDERGRFVKGHGRRRRSFKTGKDNIYPIAFAIARNIGDFGIDPANFIQIALDNMQQNEKIMNLLQGQAMDDLMVYVDKLQNT